MSKGYQTESSTSEKHLDPSVVSRGSSLERDNNGLLTLLAVKSQTIVRWRKVLWSVSLISSERNLTAASNSSIRRPTPVSGGELNPANVDSEIEALPTWRLTRLRQQRSLPPCKPLRIKCLLKSMPSLTALNKAPGLSLWIPLSLHYAMRNEWAQPS